MQSIEVNSPSLSSEIIYVAAAVILLNGKVLITQRIGNKHLSGKWEFPGGKIELGESSEIALARELQEELSITPKRFSRFCKVMHHYPEKSVLLDVWLVTAFDGEINANEGQPFSWVDINQLNKVDMPEADIEIVSALRFSDSYLISPEPADFKIDKFIEMLSNSIDNLATPIVGKKLVQLRSKSLPFDLYKEVAKFSAVICHQKSSLLLINDSFDIASDVGADGVHLSGNGLKEYNRDSEEKYGDIIVAASCHSEADIVLANTKKIDFGVISPVNKTMSHPEKDPIGWDSFRKMAYNAEFPVYALGGMVPSYIQKAKEQGGYGIAAISSLWKG